MAIRAPRSVDLASLLVLIVAAAFLVRAAASRTSSVEAEPESEGMRLSEFSNRLVDGHWVGPSDAPAVMLVYSTYACGFCGELHQSILALRQRYPQHLAVVIKHYVQPIRGPELDMALGAECAAALGVFDRYHSEAFANQEVAQDRGGWQIIADSAGVRPRHVFDECVLSQKLVAVVEAHWEDARELAIVGTPTLFVNGFRVNGAAPLPVLDSLVARVFR